MPVLLSVRDLEKSFGPRMLFRGISISFDDGERTGLIGANGSGKSTLLKILAGIESADTGDFTRRRGLCVGYLAQADHFDETASVHAILSSAMADTVADEHERDTQASILLGKLGFDRPEQPVGELSGGWRKRLAIGRELIRSPDLLLLDEPTNHLDLAGIDWLEKTLRAAPFAFVLISHDRYFLENVTRRVVELSCAYPDGYLSDSGNYSAFLEKKEAFLTAQQSRQQSLASGVRREIEWLRRGAKARTTKAKGRIEKAGAMMSDLAELKSRNAVSGPAQIDFSASGRETRKLLVAAAIGKRVGDRLLFENVDLLLSSGVCLGVLGANGSGKSTLLRIISGELAPDTGTIKTANQLQIVKFDQNRAALDPSLTLRRALLPQGDSVVFRGSAMHVTAWAKQFLFQPEQLDLPVGDLSGGEQARVLIAQLMLKPADVLILDEPTNDLDIDTLDVLEDSLANFPGAIVLVTHDRYLLDRLCTSILALDGRGGATMHADLAQWQQFASAPAPTPAPAPAPAASPAPAAQAAAKFADTQADYRPVAKPAPIRLTWKENKELSTIEADIAAAEQALTEAEAATANPALATDHRRMHAAYETLGAAKAKVEFLYERWAELEAKQR